MKKRKRIRASIGAAFMAAFALGDAAAQSALGTLASGCVSLPASRQHSLAVTTPIARGNSVMIAAAVDSGAATDVSVSDSKGNTYPGVVGRQGGAIATTAIVLRAPLQKALAVGDTITIRYGAINAAQASCVGVYGFSQIASGSQVLDVAGSADGRAASSVAVSAIGSSRSQPNLVFAGFAASGSVGAVTISAPAIALPAVCSASGTLCLLAAYRAENASGSPTMSLGIGTPRDWSGVLAALYADSIFFSGFD